MSEHSASSMIYLHAQTPMHAGAGTALGVVDLPVQRERHTHWPLIAGSGLKGVFRAACREKVANGGSLKEADNSDNIKLVFGPPTNDAHDHAGALSLTDGRVLAFPVRSLKGTFAWVSCPAALERFGRDLGIAGITDLPELPAYPQMGEVLCADALVSGSKAVFEEYDFTQKSSDKLAGLAKWIAERALADEATQKRFVSHFAILFDDDFTHFAQYATEVVARIGLDYEHKTVSKGALFYEEFVPTETVFYALAIASEAYEAKLSAVEVLGFVKEKMPVVIQVGGDQTVGKGLCSLKIG